MAKKTKKSPPPMGEEFLAVLCAEPDCDVRQSDAADAISAAWARRFNLYKVPDLLKAMLDSRGQFMDKPPTDESLFEAYRLIATRSDARGPLYKDPCFVTSERRTEFYRIMYTDVWSSLKAMHAALGEWHAAWREAASDNLALLARLDDKEAVPGVLDPPSLLEVGDASRAVARAFLKALAGHGTAVARTDAAEAARVRDLLVHPVILAATGFATTRKLVTAHKLSVTPEDVAAERDLNRFVFGALDAVSGTEPLKLVDLLRIGKRIPWKSVQGE